MPHSLPSIPRENLQNEKKKSKYFSKLLGGILFVQELKIILLRTTVGIMKSLNLFFFGGGGVKMHTCKFIQDTNDVILCPFTPIAM